jgi:nucleotide-binding universal stress UspA family protein
MYERAAQEAAATGRALASDFEVSVKAAHVWDALQRRGYAVERNPLATLKADKYTPYYRTPDDSPVYVIPAPRKVAAPAAARLTPEDRLAAIMDADPELKALVEDTRALAAEAGVDVPKPSTGADDPSTVAEAIRAAAACLASEVVA